MFDAFSPTFLWDCFWQTTLIVTIGRLVSLFYHRFPARAHRILFLTMIGCLATPVLSRTVRHFGWGIITRQSSDRVASMGQISPPIFTSPFLPKPEEAPPKSGDPSRAATPLTSLTSSPTNSPQPQMSVVPSTTNRIDWNRLLLGTWIILSGFVTMRLFISVVREISVIRKSESVHTGDLMNTVRKAAQILGLKALPVVYRSEHVSSPVICCWGHRPALLLPGSASNLRNPDEWLGIITHELAHWKRRDHIASLIAEIAVCVFPWHPLLWRARKQMDHYSELACDNWALESGQQPDSYANALVNLLPTHHSAIVQPALSREGRKKKKFDDRMHNILDGNRRHPTAGRIWAFTAVLTASALTTGIAFAQTSDSSTQSIQTRLESDSSPEEPNQKLPERNLAIARQIDVPNRVFKVSEFSLSPDGSRVAYIPDWDYKNVEVLNLTTDTTILLTEPGSVLPGAYTESTPIWSPDGTQLAMVFSEKESSSVHVVPASGGPHRIIFESKDRYFELQNWSRDKRWILASTRRKSDGKWTFSLIPAEGGDPTYLDVRGGRGGFSPNGKVISFTRRINGVLEIFLLNLQTRRESQITSTGSANLFPCWSPDGSHLIFKSRRFSSWNFWAQPMHNESPVGDPFVIKNDVLRNTILHKVLGDGRLVYSTSVSDMGIYSVPMNPDTGRPTGEPRFLTTGRNGVPSPDGKLVAYNSFNTGTGSLGGLGLTVISSDGRDRRTIRAEVKNPFSCGWFPDSQSLLTGGFDSDGTRNIYRINLTTGASESFYKRYVYLNGFAISRDGRRIAFCMPAQGKTNRNMAIYTIKPEVNAIPVLLWYSAEERSSNPTWSPDGKSIAFLSRDKQTHRVLVMPADGGNEVELASHPDNQSSYIGSMDWSPNGKFIAYKHEGEIWMVDTQGGDPFLTTNLSTHKNKQKLHWGAKGKSLYFTATKEETGSPQLWSLESYLPRNVASSSVDAE